MPTRKAKKRVRPGKQREFSSMIVKEVMEQQVRSVRLRAKGDEIALLLTKGFGAVPVVDKQRRLAGIISEHDLLAAIDEGHRLGELTAGDIMTGNPYSIRPETDLGTLVHVLRASDLVRVPVVDAKDRLVGIIARRDVLRAYLSVGSTNKK